MKTLEVWNIIHTVPRFQNKRLHDAEMSTDIVDAPVIAWISERGMDRRAHAEPVFSTTCNNTKKIERKEMHFKKFEKKSNINHIKNKRKAYKNIMCVPKINLRWGHQTRRNIAILHNLLPRNMWWFRVLVCWLHPVASRVVISRACMRVGRGGGGRQPSEEEEKRIFCNLHRSWHPRFQIRCCHNEHRQN